MSLLKNLLILSTFCLLSQEYLAEKGMWIPSQVDSSLLKLKGLEINYSTLFSNDQVSLKDAVVLFGGGCTGEVVSKNGLLFTNYHCGYSYVVKHSSLENNLLDNGFWAHSLKEEKINQGLQVSIVETIEECTDKILKGTNSEMPLHIKDSIASVNVKNMLGAIRKMPFTETHVVPFYGTNRFYAISIKTFKDVRLVGAPPRCVGEFGKESDNWMWPRHTGDFAVFRIYADSNNYPAQYSEKNVPYEAEKHFKISTKGVSQNDLTMVYGFPGRTSQYVSSYELNQRINQVNPLRITYREAYLNILKKHMQNSKKDVLNYTSKYNRVANYYKKMKGQQMGLKQVNAYEMKLNREQDCKQRDLPAEKANVAEVLDSLEVLTKQNTEYALENVSAYEVRSMIRLLNASFYKDWQKMLSDTSDQKRENALESIKKIQRHLFSEKVNQNLEKEAFVSIVELYMDAKENAVNKPFKNFVKQHESIEKLYTSIMQSPSLDSITNKKLARLSIDDLIEKTTHEPFFKFIQAFYQNHPLLYQNLRRNKSLAQSMNSAYLQAQIDLFPEEKFYPDANSTLRLAYGNVEPYTDYENQTQHWQTTTETLKTKYQSNLEHSDYELTDEFKAFIMNQNKETPTCFIASNHTTGGNSGSPVLNSKGELIGINFDRSWQSTMSDFYFNPEICRNISVDVRYVLLLIKEFGECEHIYKELDLVE